MYNAVVVVDGVALGGFFGCLGENRGYRGYVGDWQCFRGRGGVLGIIGIRGACVGYGVCAVARLFAAFVFSETGGKQNGYS